MRLPTVVQGLAGPIVVIQTKGPIPDADDDANLMGLAQYPTRTLYVRRSNEATTMRAVFFHELFHFALFDSGLSNLLDDPHTEQLCDLVGAMMARATQ